MRKNTILLFLSSLALIGPVRSQVENVIVETYYVSDSLDATDTIGGGLPTGSTTYRIYIDMKPGTKLRKIYGDANHALIFKSTDVFFNNIDRGKSFGKDINKNYLDENTAALDTWLTIGQSTTATGKYFGILKAQDTDGSIVGGPPPRNDGGSAGIPGGLLTNADSSAGVPLTTADGLDTLNTIPAYLGDYGIVDLVSSEDSTIFGSIVPDSQFISNGAFLQYSGVVGVIPDSNQVLIAQLTTKGTLSFELNIEVEQPGGIFVNYVANGDTLLAGEVLCPYLKYPPACGCKDIKYLEYSPSFACSVSDSCKTLKRFGCTDSMACNYDPSANILLVDFCCYPGNCQNRDLSLACPSLSMERYTLYPNPVQDEMVLEISSGTDEEIHYAIYDSYGRSLAENTMPVVAGTTSLKIDVSKLEIGVYIFRLARGSSVTGKIFLKK